MSVDGIERRCIQSSRQPRQPPWITLVSAYIWLPQMRILLGLSPRLHIQSPLAITHCLGTTCISIQLVQGVSIHYYHDDYLLSLGGTEGISIQGVSIHYYHDDYLLSLDGTEGISIQWVRMIRFWGLCMCSKYPGRNRESNEKMLLTDILW